MCPDRETLSAFYDNEIEEKFSITIEKHLEKCTECCNAVEVIKSCSEFISTDMNNLEAPKNRVWKGIMNELDSKNIPDIWHRRINIPLPMLAAASFVLIMITALLSSLLVTGYADKYENFNVTEAVNINGASQYYLLESEQTVNVELQLPENTFFMISGTPQLIREVDYLQANE